MTGPHDFTFASGLAFLPHCGCCGRMILHLSPIYPIYLPLSPVHCGCFGRIIFTLVPHLSPTVSSPLWVLWPHDFTLVSNYLHFAPGALVSALVA